MIEYKEGNLLDDKANYLVNTVNCVGAMGKGIAKQFKTKYPDMYKEYKKECSAGNIDIGKPYIWKHEDLFEPVTIINLPTKIHWENDSTYIYVQKGLNWLVEYFKDKPNETVALPPLGCGNGGLVWGRVKNMIEDSLMPLETRFYVYKKREESVHQWEM